jgi:hexosaminidase
MARTSRRARRASTGGWLRRRRRLAGSVLIFTAVAGVAVGLKAAASTHGVVADGPPRVVPALQVWRPSRTPFSLGSATEIIIAPRQVAALKSTAVQFAQDLRAMEGGSAPAVRIGGSADVRAGDILLALGPADAQLGDEGYTLHVSASITVSAPTEAGVFYGTRTLLQMFHAGRVVSGGTARDWPAYPDRGLMLDTAAKFFPLPWLENEIRYMAYFKLNMLHLHLGDAQAFRLESTEHPELTAPQHYSKADIKALVDLGARYHVQIVPEIDMPGHMDEILAKHPDLALKNAISPGSRLVADLANPATYTLIRQVIEEYLPLFPGKYWDAGTDEYLSDYSNQPGLLAYARAHYGPNAIAADAYYGFVNWVDALVRAHGKTLRIWNDSVASDGTVHVNKDVIVEYWQHKGAQLDPKQLADAGYQVFNASWTPTYYVLSTGDAGDKPNAAAIYSSWNPTRFQDSPTDAPVILDATEAQAVRGADINVWCDVPDAETLQQIRDGIADPLLALAQKTWGSPNRAATYGEFLKLAASVTAGSTGAAASP